MHRRTLSAAIAAGLLICTASAQAEGIVAKKLAGPPSEFAQMAEANPADSGIHSKAALLSIDFSGAKAGGYGATVSLPVEREQFRFLVFSNEGTASGWGMNVRDAKGARQRVQGKALAAEDVPFGMNNAVLGAKYFEFGSAQPGTWSVELSSMAKGRPSGYVLLEGDAATQLYSAQLPGNQFPGERVGFITSLYEADGGLDAKVGGGAARIGNATLRVIEPDTKAVSRHAMFDDGQHNDAGANDGIYGTDFMAKVAGNYLVQVEVQGRNGRGQAVVRTAEHVLPIVERDISITAKSGAARIDEDQRLSVALSVAGNRATRHYRAYAEVWGTGSKGESVPVAWVGGMIEPKDGRVELSLDPRWAELANARAPFEFRNLRLDDPDSSVTLTRAERIGFDAPQLKRLGTGGPIAIDEAMTMGPRPNGGLEAKGVGTRLLLVHGYCSGDVWPAANFTNASKYLDLNQNRTNDQFARGIQAFGNTWNSFGIVAHSQGGMAATHLYNYYWSGLDKATGNRLIQSVGTPYKGTNLAGILATLGSWFGVGCSTNNDLTYSGASAWGSGISTATRAKVNYYTTSFKLTNWYTNDYCQFATDLVLSDPEDGTTEQTYGQFSSAVNRGHTTGQCHTTGMRDVAQYKDATRNATMNTNAAR